MATVPRQRQREGAAAVLHGVSYRAYVRMIRHPDNRHTRMCYHDGTLEIVSPIHYAHEGPSRRLSLIVLFVAKALGIPAEGVGGLTVHRAGVGPLKGVGKEPDQAFYIQSLGRFPRDRHLDLDAGDPPPDLWIEVDHRASSAGRLPVYARLGVPEVWQYRTGRRSLRFLRLVDGAYVPAERSLAVPPLTASRVLEVLAPGLDMVETEFIEYLQRRIPDLIARAAVDEPRPE